MNATPWGEVPDSELDSIFNEEIVPLLQGDDPAGKPTVYLVAAQPGAGKTRSVEKVGEEHPEAIQVIGDDFRRFHPQYLEVMNVDPLQMPQLTAYASGRWVERSIDWLRERHKSLIIETTMAHSDVTDRTLNMFREVGYRNDVIVVATPPELSMMGVMIRYAHQVIEQGEGRWVDPSAHNAAVVQMPKTLGVQILKGNVDHVSVINRAGSTLYESTITTACMEQTLDRVLSAIEQGRLFGLITDDQRKQWNNDIAFLTEFCRCGNPNSDRIAHILKQLTVKPQPS